MLNRPHDLDMSTRCIERMQWLFHSIFFFLGGGWGSVWWFMMTLTLSFPGKKNTV